jgi:hypothetical protein
VADQVLAELLVLELLDDAADTCGREFLENSYLKAARVDVRESLT